MSTYLITFGIIFFVIFTFTTTWYILAKRMHEFNDSKEEFEETSTLENFLLASSIATPFAYIVAFKELPQSCSYSSFLWNYAFIITLLIYIFFWLILKLKSIIISYGQQFTFFTVIFFNILIILYLLNVALDKKHIKSQNKYNIAYHHTKVDKTCRQAPCYTYYIIYCPYKVCLENEYEFLMVEKRVFFETKKSKYIIIREYYGALGVCWMEINTK